MSEPLRCHLHVETIGQKTFRILTPRPQDGLKLSSNFYHGTWHILCAPGHVRAIRRLLWAMAFERHDNTLIALDEPVLQATPFDGAPSRPVLLACSERTSLRHDEVRALLRRLALRRASDGTVKLQTFGLDRFDAMDDAQKDAWRLQNEIERDRSGWADLRVELIGGAIALYGPPAHLQGNAAWFRSLERPQLEYEYDYSSIGEDEGRHFPGEIQVFHDYRAMLTDARLAREQGGAPCPGETPDLTSERLCLERVRRTEARKQGAKLRVEKMRQRLPGRQKPSARVVPGVKMPP